MKVLCVIDNLGWGGAQRQLVNIGCGLKELGHQVEFFTYYPPDDFKTQLQLAGIPIHTSVKHSRFSLSPIVALRRLIRRGSFTAVLALLETPAVYAELACIGMSAVRLVVGERSTVPGGRASFTRALKSHLHRLSHVVVANSQSQRHWLSRNFRFLERKTLCIWNGTDTSTFRPAPQALRSHDGIRLLGVGRVSAEKNLLRLASALGICRRRGLSVRLDWVGRIGDEAYHSTILRAVADAGLDSSWHWLGERADVPELMRQYDALILPSLFEGLPNVVCEALASALPVLASRVSDNGMLVQHGQSGLLFPADDVEGIAGAIIHFAQLAQHERDAMGRFGRVFALRELSLGKCVASYESVLTPRPRSVRRPAPQPR
jgi:glycosyltransferase involved in cell wall biosynthesis